MILRNKQLFSHSIETMHHCWPFYCVTGNELILKLAILKCIYVCSSDLINARVYFLLSYKFVVSVCAHRFLFVCVYESICFFAICQEVKCSLDPDPADHQITAVYYTNRLTQWTTIIPFNHSLSLSLYHLPNTTLSFILTHLLSYNTETSEEKKTLIQKTCTYRVIS